MKTDGNPHYLYPVYAIIGIIAVLAGLSYFIPATSDTYTAHVAAHHVRLMLTLIMTVSFCGSAYLLLKGVRIFKTTLQSAYRWFAVGNILFGLAMLQWPVIVIGGWEKTFWAVSGVVVIPFLLATLLMYIGMRHFALLLWVRSPITSRLGSAALIFAIAVASGFLSHAIAPNDTTGIDTETYTGVVAWSTGYGLLAWILVLKISRQIGAAYRDAMRALLWALGLLSFSGLHEYVTSYFLTERWAFVYWGGTLWPFLLAGFAFLRAGYVVGLARYAATTEQAQTNTGNDDLILIESITSTAELASRPEDIDPILDGLRRVTASMGVDGAATQQLTTAQRTELLHVYQRLEAYLVTSDPLRTFSREELRNRLAPAFSRLLAATNAPTTSLAP